MITTPSSGNPNLPSIDCPSASTPSLASYSATSPIRNASVVVPQSSVSVSYPTSHLPSSTAISFPSAIPSLPRASMTKHGPSTTVSSFHSPCTTAHPASASESALQSTVAMSSSSADHVRSQSFCVNQPCNVSLGSNTSPCNVSSSTDVSNASNRKACNSIASGSANVTSTSSNFGTSISSRRGQIMEINGMKFFVINSKK